MKCPQKLDVKTFGGHFNLTHPLFVMSLRLCVRNVDGNLAIVNLDVYDLDVYKGKDSADAD